MSNIPESLRKVLAKLPKKTLQPQMPVATEYSQYDVTTIYRDGAVIKNRRGRKTYDRISPIS